MAKLTTMLKSVTYSLRRARDFVSSGVRMAAVAATVLDPRLSAYLREGEELNGLGPVQIAIVRWVEDDHVQLKVLDEANREANRELARLRDRRDAAADDLYSKMLRVRQTFEDAHGPGTAPKYLGLDAGMGRVEPLVLQRYGEGSVKVLVDPGFSTPPALVEGLWQSPQSYAQQIAASLATLTDALNAYDRQNRETDVTLIARDAHYAESQTRLRWSVRFLEAVYHLAGLGAHAERLRTTFAARPSEGEPADGEVEEPPPAEEPGVSEPAAEATV